METPRNDHDEEGKIVNKMKLLDQPEAHNNNNELHVVEELIGLIEYIKSIGEYRLTQNKECHGLVRRLNLLLPLLEEIRYQNNTSISQKGIESLKKLKEAFRHAKKLLVTCHNGSKIYLAFESESIMVKFNSIYKKIFRALDDMPYDELGVTEEEIEQVELVRSQIKRSKRRNETQDMELTMDMLVLFSSENDRNADSASIERLANKLGLRTIQELREETMAVRKLGKKRRGISDDTMQHVVEILNKFKRFAGVAEDDDEPEENAMNNAIDKCPSLAIPHEFLCPITLEIMTDPVIIATGQTYERQSIQEWFDTNHRTCPKTGQVLSHLNMAPNVALKNLILQWCEINNFQLPMKEKPHSSGPSHENGGEFSSLVLDLTVDKLDVQREAVTKIRLLSKESPNNRVMIAKSGGIPPLVKLLSYPDSKIQENAVTALLNLSIDKCNKKLISEEQPFPAVIEILQSGTVGAKENSAAALFSLSMLDENKVKIGSLNGVKPLVDLLSNGTIRGKKDAITALFNLSFDQDNKIKAIESGVIKPLLEILGDKRLNMINECFSLLLLLASIPEGRKRIGQLSFVEILVNFCKDGSPKNKECATALLLELSLHNSNLMLAALQFGVYDPIAEIGRNGTSRAQRKANAILQLMNKAEQI
ncbi:ubiquitin-protein ligase [Lithospermum erythrorhizon]|uniref:RING-type E3 ubiquitin transferase n=1 Tax=Lithospermum erythrorhizon TaxID=34254 RepID=A0AAV3NRQ5_LITER